MFQGFYNLTAGVLSQTRNLNVVSNNMANVSTSGFKSDSYIASTFKQEMLYRSGNKDKSNPAAIGRSDWVTSANTTVTNYEQGGYEQTTSPLDFALGEKGFFSIQTGNGTVYTRNGSFTLDDEGYLYLPTIGRVLGENGPIRLGTDKIQADGYGNIFNENGDRLGKLSVVDFQDYDTQLTKTTGDVFTANGAGTAVNSKVQWKALERSNVDVVQQMTAMMGGQRALQSSAQVLKMYDQLMAKIVTQLGPV